MATLGWELDPADEARFAEALGGIAYAQSDRAAAKRWYDVALAIWREIGDRGEIANALYNRAYADMITVMRGEAEPDELGPGRAMMEESLAIYRELGDRGGEGNLIWGLGSYYYFTANATEAESWYRQSLDLHRSAGDRTMEAWSLHMLALSLAGQRRWDEALAVARHALRHFFEAGDISGVTLVMDDLSIVALGDGDDQRAGRLWGAARHLQATTGTALADYVEHTGNLFGISTPRDSLPPETLAGFAADGAAMGLDEVVAYALGLEDGAVPDAHVEAGR
jgi:tetratricopeptide (TPR) repeat protein